MSEPFEITVARRQTKTERQVSALSTIESGFTMGDVIGTLQMFPELRGLWPFSSVNESGNAYDLSGQGRILTNNGPAPRAFGNNIVPYASLNGSTQYFSRGDEAGLDITGALTIGGWFYPTSFTAPVSANTCVAKSSNAAPNFGYLLDFVTEAGPVTKSRFFVSSNGTANTQVSSASPVTAAAWYCLAGRFTPSTELALFTNNIKAVNTTSIPASLVNNGQPLTVGVLGAGVGNWLTGYSTLCFLCAGLVPDSLLARFFEVSRGFFGV